MDELLEGERVFISGGGRSFGRTKRVLDAFLKDMIDNGHSMVGDWGRVEHDFYNTCQNCRGAIKLEFHESGYYSVIGKLQSCVCPVQHDRTAG